MARRGGFQSPTGFLQGFLQGFCRAFCRGFAGETGGSGASRGHGASPASARPAPRGLSGGTEDCRDLPPGESAPGISPYRIPVRPPRPSAPRGVPGAGLRCPAGSVFRPRGGDEGLDDRCAGLDLVEDVGQVGARGDDVGVRRGDDATRGAAAFAAFHRLARPRGRDL